MRKKHKKQLPLMEPAAVHSKAQEWAEISCILARNNSIYERALQDLTIKDKSFNTGANGMSAEQVVHAAIVKQIEKFSYRDLSFYLADSRVFRSFCRIGIGDKLLVQDQQIHSSFPVWQPKTILTTQKIILVNHHQWNNLNKASNLYNRIYF